MNQNVTTQLTARCLEILQAAAQPLVAAELAHRLGLQGSRETQRRHIRALVRHLRDDCTAKIIATTQAGYWLTDDPDMWADYLEGRQIDAKRILAVTYKKKKSMLTDRSGQGFLFGPRISMGIG